LHVGSLRVLASIQSLLKVGSTVAGAALLPT
jgi:hypothetical protein